jgi:hypothetical protein
LPHFSQTLIKVFCTSILHNSIAIDELWSDIANNPEGLITPPFKTIRLYPQATFDINDTKQMKFFMAESIFSRLGKMGQVISLPDSLTNEMSRRESQVSQVSRIDLVENPQLEKKFEEKKEEFKNSNTPSEEILMFHGTHPSRIESILSTNFDASAPAVGKPKGSRYGPGKTLIRVDLTNKVNTVNPRRTSLRRSSIRCTSEFDEYLTNEV